MHALGVSLIPFKPTLSTEVVLPRELVTAMAQVNMTPELLAAMNGPKLEK